MTLRQLAYFVAAHDAGTMAAAAQQLHVSASAVSLGITELERILGTQLLLRVAHRPLALTPAGRSALGDARRLLAAARELESTARSDGAELAGPLHLGCFRTLAPIHVPRLVAEIAEHHPAIELHVHEASLAELRTALLDGTCELALMYDLDVADDIERELVAETRPHVLVAADHPVATCETVALADLVGEPMVMLDVHPSRAYFSELLAGLGLEPVVSRTTGSFETLRSLVARGVGWSMLIQRPAIDVSYEDLPLRSVAIADEIDVMPIVVAWPRGARLTRRAEAVRHRCRSALGITADGP